MSHICCLEGAEVFKVNLVFSDVFSPPRFSYMFSAVGVRKKMIE